MGRSYCTNCGSVGCEDDCKPKEAPIRCPECDGKMFIEYEGSTPDIYWCDGCGNEIYITE